MNERESASMHSQPIKMCSDNKNTDKNSVLRFLWRGLQMEKKNERSIDFARKELINGTEKKSACI